MNPTTVVTIHFNYEYEVARIARYGTGYKVRERDGTTTNANDIMAVLQKMGHILEPLDKRKLQIFHG